MAFQYNKPQQFKITSTLKDIKGQIAISMKEKEKLMYKAAFPLPPKSDHLQPVVIPGVAHQKVTKDVIYMVFMIQSTLKVPRHDKIDFCILHVIWE